MTHLPRKLAAATAIAAALVVPATSGAITLKQLQRQVGTLQNQVLTLQRQTASLLAFDVNTQIPFDRTDYTFFSCASYYSANQYGDPNSGTYGYPYLNQGGAALFYTSALDFTPNNAGAFRIVAVAPTCASAPFNARAKLALPLARLLGGSGVQAQLPSPRDRRPPR